jgi:hypothetical protein
VTAPVLGRQRQVDQRFDRPVGTQQGVGQLKQRVGPRVQVVIEVGPEPGQHGEGLDAGSIVQQTHPHGLCGDQVDFSKKT